MDVALPMHRADLIFRQVLILMRRYVSSMRSASVALQATIRA